MLAAVFLSALDLPPQHFGASGQSWQIYNNPKLSGNKKKIIFFNDLLLTSICFLWCNKSIEKPNHLVFRHGFWLLVLLGFPVAGTQKSGQKFQWLLSAAEEREALFCWFWFWSYLFAVWFPSWFLSFACFLINNLCATHTCKKLMIFFFLMVHVSTISYECYTNSNPKSLRVETENRKVLSMRILGVKSMFGSKLRCGEILWEVSTFILSFYSQVIFRKSPRV